MSNLTLINKIDLQDIIFSLRNRMYLCRGREITSIGPSVDITIGQGHKPVGRPVLDLARQLVQTLATKKGDLATSLIYENSSIRIEGWKPTSLM